MLSETKAKALPELKKNWEITQGTFRQLLARLDADPDRAAEKYTMLQFKLVQFFVWRACPFPEERADEALNITARKIEEGKNVRDISRYAYGVARLLCKQYKREVEEERIAQELFSTFPKAKDHDDEKELLHIYLDKCLDALTEDDRDLILTYYQEEKGAKINLRRKLAARLGNANKLRIKTCRIRAALEKGIMACMEARRAGE